MTITHSTTRCNIYSLYHILKQGWMWYPYSMAYMCLIWTPNEDGLTVCSISCFASASSISNFLMNCKQLTTTITRKQLPSEDKSRIKYKTFSKRSYPTANSTQYKYNLCTVPMACYMNYALLNIHSVENHTAQSLHREGIFLTCPWASTVAEWWSFGSDVFSLDI